MPESESVNDKKDRQPSYSAPQADTSATQPPHNRSSNMHDEVNASAQKEMLPLSNTAPPAPPPPRDILCSPWVVVVIAGIVLIFTGVALGVPWYERKQYDSVAGNHTTDRFYLYKTVHHARHGPTVTTHPHDYCTPVGRRVWATLAFTILSAVLALLFLVASVFSATRRRFKGMWPYTAMHIFAGGASIALTVTASLNFNVYLWSFATCGPQSSYHSRLYEPYVGFGLITAAWVLVIVGSVLSANPSSLPFDARMVDLLIKTFVFFSAIGFLFAVVACPITHWFYKDGTTSLVTDVLLWRHSVHHFDWNTTAPAGHTTLWVRDFGCDELIRYFRAAEAMSVVGITFTAIAVGSGLLLYKSLLGTRLPSVIFSLLGCVTLLVQMALELRIYYGNWCQGKYHYEGHYFVLYAGFGLVAAAFCITLVATVVILVAYILTNVYFPAKKPIKSAKQILIEEYQ